MFRFTTLKSSLTTLNNEKAYSKIYGSYNKSKIKGTANNQLYLIFGLSGTSDAGTYLSVLFKQNNTGNTGYIRNFGGTWYNSVTFSSNSYDIIFNNKDTYTTLNIVSAQPFTIE